MPCRSMSPSIVRLDGGERDAAGGGDVGHARHQARAERVEEELDRASGPGRRRRAPRGGRRRRRTPATWRVLAAGAGEGLDGGAAVGADHPAVGGPELELGQLPAAPHHVDGAEELRDVDAVGGHGLGAWRSCSASLAIGCRPVGATWPTDAGRAAPGLGEHGGGCRWRTPAGHHWRRDLRVRGLRARHRALRAAPGGRALPGRAPGVRRPPLPRRAPRPGRHEGGAARQRLGRPVRERVGAHEPDQGGPPGARRQRARSSGSSRTAHGRGYRFLPPVVVPARRDGRPSPPAGRDIRYARSGDGEHRVRADRGAARSTSSSSPASSPTSRSTGRTRARPRSSSASAGTGRLIRFDKRGTGLSDRPPDLPDLETRMDDVRGGDGRRRAASERWCFGVLRGRADGRPLRGDVPGSHRKPSCSTAPTPGGSAADDYPWAADARGAAWRTPRRPRPSGASRSDMQRMCPNADDAMADWWQRRARAAASPGAARALIEMNSLIDIRDVLPTIRVPTLVLHRRGDPDAPVERRTLRRRADAGRAGSSSWRAIDHVPWIDADAGARPDRGVPRARSTAAEPAAAGGHRSGRWPRRCSPTSSGRPT